MNIRTCWSYHRKSDIFASGIALRVCARRNLPCRVAIRLTKAVTSTYDENENMIDGDRIGEKATKRRELIIISQKPVVVIKERFRATKYAYSFFHPIRTQYVPCMFTYMVYSQCILEAFPLFYTTHQDLDCLWNFLVLREPRNLV